MPALSECPICENTKEELPRIMSLDGNFRLVRKKTAGTSHCPPRHGTNFFLQEEDMANVIPLPAEELANVDVSCK
jgi:hypothetical protein